MVGESWIVDVVLDGALNEESMVLDFGKVKKRLKALIDDYVDHKLLVPADHPFSTVSRDPSSDTVQVDFARPDGRSIHLCCPAEAYAFVYAEAVTMASVGQYLKDIIATHLPENVQGLQIALRSEIIDTPYYHYTHGLKKHDGNCQRIAHGHRSKVNVIENGVSSQQWAQYWAERWCDIYIGTREDLIPLHDSVWRDSAYNLDAHHVFGYEASQGMFYLAIPEAECELVDTDSTVECLAQFMADEQKRLCPDSAFEIWAYEGVGKGAIAYA